MVKSEILDSKARLDLMVDLVNENDIYDVLISVCNIFLNSKQFDMAVLFILKNSTGLKGLTGDRGVKGLRGPSMR